MQWLENERQEHEELERRIDRLEKELVLAHERLLDLEQKVSG